MTDEAEEYFSIRDAFDRERQRVGDAVAHDGVWEGTDGSGAVIVTLTAETATFFGIPAVPGTVTAGAIIGVTALGVATAILYSSAGSARTTLASAASGIQTWPKFAS